MRTRQPDKALSLKELRYLINKHKEKGREIVTELKRLESHYNKMLEYYEEWESDLNFIQEEIQKAAKEHDVPEAEIENSDPLGEFLDEGRQSGDDTESIFRSYFTKVPENE